jgi:hypothetical protein
LITQQGDTVLTSDDDIEHLLGHRDVHATVQTIELGSHGPVSS